MLVSESHEVHPETVEQSSHETKKKVKADYDWDSSNDSGLISEPRALLGEPYYLAEDNESKLEGILFVEIAILCSIVLSFKK